MATNLPHFTLRPGVPDFLSLPWDAPLEDWQSRCEFLEEVPRGLSRHPIVFFNYAGTLYALKELPLDVAALEFKTLLQIEELKLPAVTTAGYVHTRTSRGMAGVLITRYLERSLPYRTLFESSSLQRYRRHLLDAMASLLVQLHANGVFWGDCSLSNTLFRRDAGTLQAYLVDAETAEIYPNRLSPTLRHHDLQIMEENVNAELAELRPPDPLEPDLPVDTTGASIRLRYQLLWEEISREEIIGPQEHYRIQERLRALNALGFTVKEVMLEGSETGNQLRLRVMVTDRSFHRDQLQGLTGVDAEEKQAREMMNEIMELNATLAQSQNRSITLDVAAFHWLENVYKPTILRLEPLVDSHTSLPELYVQLLEHKWYLSERAQHDVGHQAAADDYLMQFGNLPPLTSQN